MLTTLSDQLTWMLPRQLMSQKPTAGRYGRLPTAISKARYLWALHTGPIRLKSKQVNASPSLGVTHDHGLRAWLLKSLAALDLALGFCVDLAF